MTIALRFVGGDELIEPFLLEGSDGEIIDLNSVTITGGVWWRERLRIPLSIGSGISITTNQPARAEGENDQAPHGIITLSEAQTVLIPQGQVASLRLVAVRTLDQVTMSTFLVPLERIV